jgi:hypothetical protein
MSPAAATGRRNKANGAYRSSLQPEAAARSRPRAALAAAAAAVEPKVSAVVRLCHLHESITHSVLASCIDFKTDANVYQRHDNDECSVHDHGSNTSAH